MRTLRWLEVFYWPLLLLFVLGSMLGCEQSALAAAALLPLPLLRPFGRGAGRRGAAPA